VWASKYSVRGVIKFRAEDLALPTDEEGQKRGKGQTFSDHTYTMVSSR